MRKVLLFPAPHYYLADLALPTTLPIRDSTVERCTTACDWLPAFNCVLKHPGAMRRMFTPPIELSLGDVFVHVDFDIEDDLFSDLYITGNKYRRYEEFIYSV